MKFIYLILGVVGGMFLLVFVAGFVGAWIISIKKEKPEYAGPTTKSGLWFWMTGKATSLLEYIKTLLDIKS